MSVSTGTSGLSNDVLLIVFFLKPDEARVEKIKAQHPGLEVRWTSAVTPEGGFKKPEEYLDETCKEVTLLMPFIWPPPKEYLPKVRFVQLISAGIDPWIGHATYNDKNVLFCSTNGVHAPQIAEWVFGTYLSHQHRFPQFAKQMTTGTWTPPDLRGIQNCTGARIGILGYGAIGRQCARIGKAMGMDVYAYTRSEKSTPEKRKDDSYCVPGTGDPDGLLPSKWFHGGSKEDVNHFLEQDLDLLVLTLPLTQENKGILGRQQFEILSKKKTFVSNISRGGHIDQDALLEALESGKIRGAAIDVTDPEPLPSDHKLWKAPNLLITPHVSASSDMLADRILDVLELNLERLSTGKPLINVVNRELNY